MEPKSNNPTYPLIAMGAPQHQPVVAPGLGAGAKETVRFPHVDEYTIEPNTYTERWEGQIVHVMPSNPPHAIRNADLPGVLKNALSPGYIGAVDMLTRVEERTEIAPDYCIFRAAKTPDGHYEICDIAFEVLDTQTRANVLKRAKKFVARGCRRVFLVDVNSSTVAEYDSTRDAWDNLANDHVIHDPVFATGIAVFQLFEAGSAIAVALAAAAARKDPEFVALTAQLREEGARMAALQTTRTILLQVLHSKFAYASDPRVTDCTDLQQLNAWLARALSASTMDEVWTEAV